MIWGIFFFFFCLSRFPMIRLAPPPFNLLRTPLFILHAIQLKFMLMNINLQSICMYFIRVQKILQTDKINVWVPFAAVPAEIVALLTI